MDHIKYQAGYKYQLYETYNIRLNFLPPAEINNHRFIFLTAGGWLTIKIGYAWDGPSGPTYDSKSFMRGSLVHDALYQLMREGLLPESYRVLADRELHRICREDGMSKLRAWYVLKGVRDFGSSASALKADPVIIAPQQRRCR